MILFCLCNKAIKLRIEQGQIMLLHVRENGGRHKHHIMSNFIAYKRNITWETVNR